jgi:hypothetical protein
MALQRLFNLSLYIDPAAVLKSILLS